MANDSKKYRNAKFYISLFNKFTHAFILICILSALFWKVIKIDMDNNTKNQINSNLQSNIDNMFKSLENTDSKIIGEHKDQLISDIEDKCKKLTITDDLKKNHKTLAINNIIFGVVVFFCAFVCAVLAHRNMKSIDAGLKTGLTDIIWLNFILFFFVGVCELTFFELIASKYIPIDPSDASDVLLNTLSETIGEKIEKTRTNA